MNVLNYPKLTLQIEGKNQIRDLYIVENFKPSRSHENTWELDNTIDFISIYPSTLQLPIRKVIIEAPIYNNKIEQAYVIELKTTVELSPSGETSFIEEVESNTIKSYSETFGAKIINLEIRSTSVESKVINTKIYCWEDV